MAEAIAGTTPGTGARRTPGCVGPFLCPTTRAHRAARDPAARRSTWRSSLVVDAGPAVTAAGPGAATADDRITLVAVEASHARLGHDAATVGATVRRMPSVTGYLEVDPSDVGCRWTSSLPAAAGRPAKYRTGGATPDAFPTEQALADFLVATVERGLPFKLTAGLHHVVRRTEPETGFEQHGLLNVLVATADALAREDLDVIVASLAERDVDRLVERVLSWSELRLSRASAGRSGPSAAVPSPSRSTSWTLGSGRSGGAT